MTDANAGAMTDDEAEAKESVEEKKATPPDTGKGRGRRVLLVLLILSAAFCGWSAFSYWQTTHDDSLAFSKTRDQVSKSAREAIATLNTIDVRQPDPGLRAWLEVTTGPLREELNRSNNANRAKLQQAGISTEGVVTDLAVTELDLRAGTAQVIATVEIKMTRLSGTPEGSDRKRFAATLARTGGDWKLRSLTAFPAGQG
jgi:Mce-associated membrane protein